MKYIKTTIGFIIFNIIVAIFTAPVLLAYGPFGDLKDLTLRTVMETRRGPMIMSYFMSQQAMDKYKLGAGATDNDSADTNAIKIPKQHDQSIEVKQYENNRFTYYVMLIHDPTRVKVAASKSIPEQGERVSDMAREANAVGAINGGGFIDTSWQGNGGKPIGITMSNGKVISSDEGEYVIGITRDGALMMGKYTMEEVRKLNITDCVSFPGPVLVRKGQGLNPGSGMNPRTAIGQAKDGTIIFLVVDGRSFRSQGATYKDLQDIMLEFGAYNAVNLDGGSSTTMYYDGDVINNPGNLMGERYVPTAFIVTP